MLSIAMPYHGLGATYFLDCATTPTPPDAATVTSTAQGDLGPIRPLVGPQQSYGGDSVPGSTASGLRDRPLRSAAPLLLCCCTCAANTRQTLAEAMSAKVPEIPESWRRSPIGDPAGDGAIHRDHRGHRHADLLLRSA